jgi:esterase/lipase superfamily enzyme
MRAELDTDWPRGPDHLEFTFMRVGKTPYRTFAAWPVAICVLASLGLSGCQSVGLGDMSALASPSLFSAGTKRAALPVTIFVASTRKDDRHVADAVVDGGVHHSMITVSVPAGHKAGVIETPTFGKPSPSRHFAVTYGRTLTPTAFEEQIGTHLSGRVGSNRDVLVYVHGFNTSLEEARFRLAQIVADARFGGVPVLFTWPSQSNLLSYVSDKERATASRDALEELLHDLSETPGIGRVHVLAHSMGSWLAMEALRENAIAGRADLNGKLGDVMLAAPDIDLGVFRQQMARLGKAHVSVFSSQEDRALSLSSRISGDRTRLGTVNPRDPRDRAALEGLGVKVYDISNFSSGFIGHGAYAESADVIRSIGAQLAEPRKEDATAMAVIKGTDEAVTAVTPAAAAAQPTIAQTAAPDPETPAGAVTASPLAPPPAPATPVAPAAPAAPAQ